VQNSSNFQSKPVFSPLQQAGKTGPTTCLGDTQCLAGFSKITCEAMMQSHQDFKIIFLKSNLRGNKEKRDTLEIYKAGTFGKHIQYNNLRDFLKNYLVQIS
jgi:hypothetical protein